HVTQHRGEIAQSCPSATAAVPHPNSITIFPASSSPARAEEGTRQVASYSSTISGPVLPPPRSERRTTGVLTLPCAAPSHAGRGGGGGGRTGPLIVEEYDAT